MKPPSPFLVAMQFLTRLPVPMRSPPDEERLARSLIYYPLVGLVLGLLIAALHGGLGNAPAMVRAALVLTAWIALTGALHLDGLADSADAWAGGAGDRTRTLALMQDPHCGPMAAVTLGLVLLLKLAGLHALPTDAAFLLALVPVLARSLIPLLFAVTPYVRPGGIGSALARRPPPVYVGAACVAIPGSLGVLIAGARGAALLLTALGVFAILRGAMMKRIGGTTGDTAGALVETSETAMLVALVLV